LGLDGIGRRSVEGLGPQVLLDPTEQQLDLPAHLEDVSHGLRRDHENVGQEHEPLLTESFNSKSSSSLERPGRRDEMLSEGLVDPVIAQLVDIRQG